MVRVRAAVESAEDLKPVIRRVGYVPLQGLVVDVPKDEIDGIGHIPGLAPIRSIPKRLRTLALRQMPRSGSRWLYRRVRAPASRS